MSYEGCCEADVEVGAEGAWPQWGWAIEKGYLLKLAGDKDNEEGIRGGNLNFDAEREALKTRLRK